MPITEQDIKLLKSARMSDTPDGGGRMTAEVVQSGVDNNIFDDVSNLDRVYGNVSLRKVFPAVLTNDTDKFLGARVIIDEPPADEYVHGLIFGASSLFDTRSQTSVKVESYLAPGGFYQGLLYGNHLAGMSTVLLIQQVDRSLPVIGQVLLLRKNEGLPNELDQYVKVTDVSAAQQSFTDGSGDFIRTVVTCGISDALREAFPGFQASRIDADISFVDKTRVFDTVVADASQYFGIRPLETAASSGAFTIKADTAYSPLLPSAQIETPIADARSNGVINAMVAAGTPVSLLVNAVFTTTTKLFIGGGVLPGSLALVRGGVTLTDEGGALKNGGVEVGAVDYENGILTLSTNVFGTGGGIQDITYTPADSVPFIGQSFGIPINISNRALNYTRTLGTPPAPGSVTVSYLVGGAWYVLRDNGTGGVVGATSALGAGSINYETGTLAVTLGALPDVGGAIIVQWAEKQLVTPQANTEMLNGGKLYIPFNTDGNVSESAGSKTLAPGALTITWNNGGARTVTDNGNGVLSGDGTGTVDYAKGVVRLSPNTLPPFGTQITLAYDSASTTSSGAVSIFGGSIGGNVTPSTVIFDMEIGVTYYHSGVVQSGYNSVIYPASTIAQTVTVRDDGNGHLQFVDGRNGPVVVGSINYTTGVISVASGNITLGVYEDNAAVSVQVSSPYFGPTLNNWNGWVDNNSPGVTRNGVVTPGQTKVVSRSIGAFAAGVPIIVTANSFKLKANIIPGNTLRRLHFAIGGTVYESTAAGGLIKNVNANTGNGTAAGTVIPATGEVTVQSWPENESSTPVDLMAIQAPPTEGLTAPFAATAVMFRTAAAPLRPGSLSVLATLMDGTAVNVTAGINGKIDTARIKGQVNYETGVVELYFTNPAIIDPQAPTVDVSGLQIAGVTVIPEDLVRTPSIRYNAVSYTYLPLDAGILGLDPVRLPSDGRVPVFKSGRVVVVHNTQKLSPQTVSNSQVVNCGRLRLSRLRVFGNDSVEITTGFTKNLDAGTVTFTNVAGFSQPVTVEHRIEDEALCAEAQITGSLRLTRPVTHDYPVPGSYVSSALVIGTLQAAAQDGFSQETWTTVWSDVAIGNPILAQYNDTANPVVVTNAGAISERWAIIFTSNTAFNLVGEQVGLIIAGSTAADLTPVNPATGVPYFTLASAGWGSGWAAGNVYRFNTSGANFPLWVARTVLQSPTADPGTDQLKLSVRGDIDQ